MSSSVKLIRIFLVVSTVGVIGAHGEDQCGQQSGFEGYVFNGDLTKKGEWPWLVGFIYLQNNHFFCGGSIISKKHILSGEIK